MRYSTNFPGRLIRKLFSSIILLLFITTESSAQTSITGSNCVVPGTQYVYTISGSWGQTTSMTWSVVGGSFVGSSSGTPRPQVTVIWTSGSGRSISVVKSNPSGSASLPVSISPALVVGTISNPSQTINWNVVPSTINCTAASGGYCTPNITYQWQSSTDNVNFTPISGATGQNLTFSAPLTQTTYYQRKVTETNSGTTATTSSATVFVYPQLIPGAVTPATATINYNTSPGPISIAGASGGNGSYTYIWQWSSDGINWNTISGATTTSYTPGNLVATTYFHVAVFSNGAEAYSANSYITVIPPPAGVPAATNTVGCANTNINWVFDRTFDASGNIINESKLFFNNNGGLVQSQNKVFYRKDINNVYAHVLANQVIRDEYGRESIKTLSAPIDYSDFCYIPGFVQANDGTAYGYKNFDRYNPSGTETDKTNSPETIGGQGVRGTLGWYYGINNSWEIYTPVTSYPYSRQTYYRDGTGEAKKQGGLGEVFTMGSGRETTGYSAPVINELNHYIAVRNKFFTAAEIGNEPANLVSQSVVSVSRDANGFESTVIRDVNGNILMTGRTGTDLQISNTASISPGGFQYFKLVASSVVTVTGGSYSIYNMDTYNEPLVTGFSSGSPLAAGYYKLVNTDLVNGISLSYTNGYVDVCYKYYNQLGQLIATIAPEGVKKLYGTGINNYASRSTIPYISLLQYDLNGRLISKTTPDGGTSKIIYRQDGKIRFSQTALQAVVGSYNYLNYDQYGRTIESGQYLPDGSGIVYGSAGMTSILENTSNTGGLTTGVKTDVIMSLYDLSDNSHGQSLYVQDMSNLGGMLSTTKRYSSITNNVINSATLVSQTWYNYDEEGRPVWQIRYVASLGASGYKTEDLTYDAMGRLIKKIFQKNSSSETFVHYYQYDAANGNLWKVYTNTVDNPATELLQATYIYYLHGPLKRVELATNLQGTDFTYTISGALKSINNNNKNQDPGLDGANGFSADAFGMELDYFNGDYVNGRVGSQQIKGVNTSGVAGFVENYSGNIKSMSWYSEKPAGLGLSDAPLAYVFQYDPKYQFTSSTWGNGLDFSTTPATMTTTNLNKETVLDPVSGVPGYDANGNIKFLQRTDGSGNPLDKFTYNYNGVNNQIQTVATNPNGTSTTYATYSYNQNGQVTLENTGDITKIKYIQYDIWGNVTKVARDAGFANLVVQYVYDENGKRIEKMTYNSSYQLTLNTFYFDDVVYTQTVSGGVTGALTVQEYQLNGGLNRLGIFYKQSNIYAYQMSDHLGNVRAIIAQSGSTYQVRMYTDFYPFGMPVATAGTNDYRFGYQGQYAEKDNETNWNAFELRMYDSRIARWFQYDPKEQYYTPYQGMGNNPINGVDKDGAFWDDYQLNDDGTVSLIRQTQDKFDRFFNSSGEYLFQIGQTLSPRADWNNLSQNFQDEIAFAVGKVSLQIYTDDQLSNTIASRAVETGWDATATLKTLKQQGRTYKIVLFTDILTSRTKIPTDQNMREGKPKSLIQTVPYLKKVDDAYPWLTDGRDLQYDLTHPGNSVREAKSWWQNFADIWNQGVRDFSNWTPGIPTGR